MILAGGFFFCFVNRCWLIFWMTKARSIKKTSLLIRARIDDNCFFIFSASLVALAKSVISQKRMAAPMMVSFSYTGRNSERHFLLMGRLKEGTGSGLLHFTPSRMTDLKISSRPLSLKAAYSKKDSPMI